MPEDEHFMVEAAEYYGFEPIDDEATVYCATEAQIVALVKAVLEKGRLQEKTQTWLDHVPLSTIQGADDVPALPDDARAALIAAREWVEHAIAPLRFLPPKAAEPGEAILQQIDEVLSARPDGWQPIETAPKADPACPVGGPSILIGGIDYAVEGWWGGPHAPRWFIDFDEDAGPVEPSSPPTHWRPLPSPPAPPAHTGQGK